MQALKQYNIIFYTFQELKINKIYIETKKN